ncbi:hypothetical protein KFK09_010346 [Dendrobium nobile]|uniref:Uncharacterized protein n=1 Tax=Dendrobium nobile TaxID=94219 RepID=A0A8T3BLY0_DENNO|nr:hypothetical protein KFK09_010346 [Dendrobium nobile]
MFAMQNMRLSLSVVCKYAVGMFVLTFTFTSHFDVVAQNHLSNPCKGWRSPVSLVTFKCGLGYQNY